MKKKIYPIILFIISSCSSVVKEINLNNCNNVANINIIEKDTLVNCYLNKVSQKISIPLSHLLQDYKLVKLDNQTKDMMISPISSVYISDSYIVTIGNEYYNQIKLFNKDGAFIREIGKAGNGPEDFTPPVFKATIDESKDKLFIADCKFKQISIYSLSTGKYIDRIPLAHQSVFPSLIINSNDSILYITNTITLNTQPMLWAQNFSGSILNEISSSYWGTKKEWIAGSNDVLLWKHNNNYIFSIIQSPPIQDSLYHYDIKEKKIKPCFTVDFAGEDIPDHWMYETADYYLLTINGNTNGNVSSGFMNKPQKRVLIDKGSLKGAYIDILLDKYGNIPITQQRFYMWNEYFTLTLTPEWITEMAKTELIHSNTLQYKDKENLQTLINKTTEEDNIYILYGKIK